MSHKSLKEKIEELVTEYCKETGVAIDSIDINWLSTVGSIFDSIHDITIHAHLVPKLKEKESD